MAIITGAARGIGWTYAEALAARGAKIVLHDVGAGTDGTGNDPDVAEFAAERIRSTGGTAKAASAPIDDRQSCIQLVQDAVAEFGRCDILVHNAGWVAYQRISELTPEFLRRVIALQIEAPVWLAQAAWQHMAAQSYGRIIFTTSDRAIYAQYALHGLSAYAVGKLAQIGLMNILAAEGSAVGIRVNCISPVAKTRMWGVQGEPDDLKPQAIVPGLLYLASECCDESGWILRASNGQFHAVKWAEADQVTYPADIAGFAARTAEDVKANWHRIAIPQKEERSRATAQTPTASSMI